MALDRTVELYVDGMTCSHCVASVTEELKEVEGVSNVEVVLKANKTSLVTVHTQTGVDDDALKDAISEAGYTLTEIKRDF